MSRAKGEISGRLMEPREIKLVGMVESVARGIQGRTRGPPWHIPRSEEKRTIRGSIGEELYREPEKLYFYRIG